MIEAILTQEQKVAVVLKTWRFGFLRLHQKYLLVPFYLRVVSRHFYSISCRWKSCPRHKCDRGLGHTLARPGSMGTASSHTALCIDIRGTDSDLKQTSDNGGYARWWLCKMASWSPACIRIKAVLHYAIFCATCLAILLQHKLHEKLHGVTYLQSSSLATFLLQQALHEAQ